MRQAGVRRPDGFSMIELMIALAVMSIAILAVLGVFPVMTDLDRSSSQQSYALYAGQEIMDELLRQNNFVATTPQTTMIWNGKVTSISPPTDLPSSQSTTRTYWGDAPAGGQQHIYVQVQWLDRYGLHKLILSSAVTPNV